MVASWCRLRVALMKGRQAASRCRSDAPTTQLQAEILLVERRLAILSSLPFEAAIPHEKGSPLRRFPSFLASQSSHRASILARLVPLVPSASLCWLMSAMHSRCGAPAVLELCPRPRSSNPQISMMMASSLNTAVDAHRWDYLLQSSRLPDCTCI